MGQGSFIKTQLPGDKTKEITDLLKVNPSFSTAEKIYKTI
jgi:hypothetical protein